MWTWVGESAMLARYDGPLEDANLIVHATAAEARRADFDSVEEIVPGARTVLVRLRPGATPDANLQDLLETGAPPRSLDDAASPLRIPVAYGGEDGPDLIDTADRCGMPARELVALHTSTDFRVAFVGFMPGFPYLLGLPAKLQLPRLSTPRTRVPAGSVAIAGPFTGVYPSSSPGGWRILGRTEAKLFDPFKVPPAWTPGRRVRFEAL